MTINLKGVTRIVIILRNVVIKIPNFTSQWNHFLLGLISNINENRLWKWNSGKYANKYTHLLCPVIWCSWGGWMLIMKRADTDTLLAAYERGERFDTSKHEEYFPGDDTVSNYGYLNGRLVKIDYGQLDRPWS